MWSVWVTDTVSGAKLQKLPVSAFPWGRVLNGGLTGTATVQLLDADVQKINPRYLTTPAKNTLVLQWSPGGGSFGPPVVVYAGIITGRKYNRDAGTLSVDTADIWWLLARRLAVDHTSSTVWATIQTYTATSLGTIAKASMILGATGPADGNYPLPITLPADEAGTITRKYYGYHLNVLADVLKDLMNEVNGPDIDFQPRWVNNQLDWLMRVGTTAAPKLTSGSWDWSLTAEGSGLSNVTVTEDANKLATNSVGIGEGSENKTLMRSDRVVNPLYPAIDRVSSYKKETDALRLAALVDGDIAAYKQPTKEWGFSIVADGPPSVSSLLLGGTGRVWSGGDPWIPDGWSANRLVGISGDLSEIVNLKFQPDRDA
jgi:hypothetical protein